MERLSSLSTFSPSCSRPSSFFSHGGNTHYLKLHQTTTEQDTKLRIKPSSVKPIRSSRKPTLSTNWDISGISSPSMPRLEDLDTTNMLLRQRIVFLGSQVDDPTADFIISQLLFLDAEDQKKDIKLFINSPGGSITAGMGIYDAMKLCKADVSTTCLGLAASMGAFLLAAGAKGKRYCMPNARVMIHQPSGTYGGRSTEMALRVREMTYHKIKLNKIFSRITGKPEEEIEEDCRYDKFMSPWEALEYGLVDEVIDDGKPGLVAPIADSSPPPKSQVWSLWDANMVIDPKLLPSEEKLLQEGQNGVEESNEGKEPAPTTV